MVSGGEESPVAGLFEVSAAEQEGQVRVGFARDRQGLLVPPVDFELSVETYSFLTRHGQSLPPVSRIVAKEVMRAVTDKSN